MYLTSSYFVGELEIPNITGTTNPEVANFTNLMNFILKYEKEFLKRLLGDDFYDEFVAGVEAEESKWTDLYDQIYTTETQTIGDDSYTLYISPSANYVYYHYMRNNQSVTMFSGEAKAKFENAEAASNLSKMVQAYNKMVDMIDDLWEWLDDNIATYTTWVAGNADSFPKINQMNV